MRSVLGSWYLGDGGGRGCPQLARRLRRVKRASHAGGEWPVASEQMESGLVRIWAEEENNG